MPKYGQRIKVRCVLGGYHIGHVGSVSETDGVILFKCLVPAEKSGWSSGKLYFVSINSIIEER